MSLSRKIVDAVDAIPETATFPVALVVSEETPAGPLQIRAMLSLSGLVGQAMESLTFQRNCPKPLNASELRTWGERLVARVNYLLEPLVVLEVDGVGGEAEIRSKVPSTRGDVRSFYEIRLNASGTLQFQRFAFDRNSRRRSVTPFQLTREALERLVDDLVETATVNAPGVR